MLEPLLLGVVDAPVWVDTSIPEVKAAVIRCDRGVLVLPMWLGRARNTSSASRPRSS